MSVSTGVKLSSQDPLVLCKNINGITLMGIYTWGCLYIMPGRKVFALDLGNVVILSA